MARLLSSLLITRKTEVMASGHLKLIPVKGTHKSFHLQLCPILLLFNRLPTKSVHDTLLYSGKPCTNWDMHGWAKKYLARQHFPISVLKALSNKLNPTKQVKSWRKAPSDQVIRDHTLKWSYLKYDHMPATSFPRLSVTADYIAKLVASLPG